MVHDARMCTVHVQGCDLPLTWGVHYNCSCCVLYRHQQSHMHAYCSHRSHITCVAAAELTPSQARINLPPSHPLLNNTRPAAAAPHLNTSSNTPHLSPPPAAIQHAQNTSTESMHSKLKAPAHADAAVAEGPTGAAAMAVAAVAVATTAASSDVLGIASQSSKGSSRTSIAAAAASGVVTRLRKAGTGCMSGASLPASDGSQAGQSQPSQPELADPARLGKMSDQAGHGLSNNGKIAVEAAVKEKEDRSTSGVKSSGHGAAAAGCEESLDVMMADGSMADDEAAGEAEMAGLAVVSAPDTSSLEAQGRQVSFWLGITVMAACDIRTTALFDIVQDRG